MVEGTQRRILQDVELGDGEQVEAKDWYIEMGETEDVRSSRVLS